MREVQALRDFPNQDPKWENGLVIGKWHENLIGHDEERGLKVQFEDGEIQEIPYDFIKEIK